MLLEASAGLQQPSEGRILLGGKDISGWGYHRLQNAGVAYMAAGRLEEGLVAGLTLTEHMVLAQPEQTFFVNWEEMQLKTARRIDHYQVVGRPNSTADELSGGNQQRLLFALLNRQLRLLLLEHPTRGLDIRSANWIWEQLYERRKEGTAVVFISADLDEVVERSDRIAVFFGGRLLQIVSAEETTVEELGHLIGGEL